MGEVMIKEKETLFGVNKLAKINLRRNEKLFFLNKK
jgi:hypothetical protein